jgi:putative DNA primase/helicase
MIRTPLRDRTRGYWHTILPAIGIAQCYLTGKNGPCPLCPEGGRDRWRFLNTDGNGTWICTHCGAGSGTDLVMRFTGLPFKHVARRIESVIGRGLSPRSEERRQVDPRAGLNRLWRSGVRVTPGDPTDLWLRSRGVGMDFYPTRLRSSAAVRYADDSTTHPAMLAMVTAPDGRPCTIHRTYLTADGHKAPVGKPRKLYSSVARGSAVRLTTVAPTLGVAEGIETALAATKLFGIPTWAAICAAMLETFEVPTGVTTLVVFGDNDLNGVGQRAAHALAARLSGQFKVDVRIPDRAGDWNDVLLGKST